MELKFAEHATVDSDRLVELCIRMGESRAEEMISSSIEELWSGLEELRSAYAQQRLSVVQEQAAQMADIADHLGLYLFAKVSRDVKNCAAGGDGTSLAACMCRLHRLADSTINSVWDLCDISS
ncbi:MAG: hypothetical protein AAGA08_01190 [Pseudomonadota bacterium]